MGKIIQLEISIEGRLIITLEEGAKTLKIWYNDYQKESAEEMNGVSTPRKLSNKSPFQVIFCNLYFSLLEMEEKVLQVSSKLKTIREER